MVKNAEEDLQAQLRSDVQRMFIGTFLSLPRGFVLASQSSSPFMEAEWYEQLRVETLISLKPHGKRVSVSQHFSRSLGIESH